MVMRKDVALALLIAVGTSFLDSILGVLVCGMLVAMVTISRWERPASPDAYATHAIKGLVFLFGLWGCGTLCGLILQAGLEQTSLSGATALVVVSGVLGMLSIAALSHMVRKSW